MLFLNNTLVSIVIPTFNSETFIEGCLKSIRLQTYSNVEIIVVDNHSTDKTVEIAELYGAVIIPFRGIRSDARNVGFKFAKGDYFLSLDSDMELTSDVVRDCVEYSTFFEAIIIPELSVGSGFWVKCKALEKSCYIGDDLIEASRFFKRSVFESVAGYDSELEAGEDWDLNSRIRDMGYKIGRVKSIIKHHEGNLSLSRTFSKKYYYGKTLQIYRKKHPQEAAKQFTIFRPAFYRNFDRLINQPDCALGMFFIKSCEFIAGWLGSLSV